MKISKKAKQKNVTVDTTYYTQEQLNDMLYNEDIFYFRESKDCYERLETWEFANIELRIFTDTIEEIKVVVDDYGYYSNIAVTKKGFTIYVEL